MAAAAGDETSSTFPGDTGVGSSSGASARFDPRACTERFNERYLARSASRATLGCQAIPRAQIELYLLPMSLLDWAQQLDQ
jgi:hypothetical protein